MRQCEQRVAHSIVLQAWQPGQKAEGFTLHAATHAACVAARSSKGVPARQAPPETPLPPTGRTATGSRCCQMTRRGWRLPGRTLASRGPCAPPVCGAPAGHAGGAVHAAPAQRECACSHASGRCSGGATSLQRGRAWNMQRRAGGRHLITRPAATVLVPAAAAPFSRRWGPSRQRPRALPPPRQPTFICRRSMTYTPPSKQPATRYSPSSRAVSPPIGYTLLHAGPQPSPSGCRHGRQVEAEAGK